MQKQGRRMNADLSARWCVTKKQNVFIIDAESVVKRANMKKIVSLAIYTPPRLISALNYLVYHLVLVSKMLQNFQLILENGLC